MENFIIEAIDIKKYFKAKKAIVKAVDGITLKIPYGKTMGIVGESGSGKTTLGRSVLGLTKITGGKVLYNGEEISNLKGKAFDRIRPQIQIIFQDPYSSLPPRMAVGDIISEAVKVHKIVPKKQVKEYVLSVMEKCGINGEFYKRYPREFSGGQRQRICIARALAVKPKFVVCDEPVSALDVSIEAQILNLLKDLQAEMNLSYLFISHDLSVVKYISDSVGVMYLGSLMESGLTADIYNKPMHPYTKALLSAIPIADLGAKRKRIILSGEIPSPSNMPNGCKFHTRCGECMEICKAVPPKLIEYEKNHFCACHLYEKI